MNNPYPTWRPCTGCGNIHRRGVGAVMFWIRFCFISLALVLLTSTELGAGVRLRSSRSMPQCRDLLKGEANSPSVAALRKMYDRLYDGREDRKLLPLVGMLSPLNDETNISVDQWPQLLTNCHIQSSEGHFDSPLSILVKAGLVGTVKALTSSGHVNNHDLMRARDAWGNNVFHMAILSGNDRLIPVLGFQIREESVHMIEGPAAKNKMSLTPRDLARRSGRKDMLQALKKIWTFYKNVQNPNQAADELDWSPVLQQAPAVPDGESNELPDDGSGGPPYPPPPPQSRPQYPPAPNSSPPYFPPAAQPIPAAGSYPAQQQPMPMGSFAAQPMPPVGSYPVQQLAPQGSYAQPLMPYAPQGALPVQYIPPGSVVAAPYAVASFAHQPHAPQQSMSYAMARA